MVIMNDNDLAPEEVINGFFYMISPQIAPLMKSNVITWT
jgi:hypothetical protein